jgi:ABC-type multidrug transport system fused ATPase/permease subunit
MTNVCNHVKSTSQGDLMSRVTNDIDNLNQALTQSVVQIISSALTLLYATSFFVT